MDRGRRKTRGMGGWIGFGTEEDDGYVQEGSGYYEISDEDESEVSEALADAILKRPGSLRLAMAKNRRLRSSPSTELATDKSSPGSESQAEFTFPSLSDLGNVKWGKRVEKANVDKHNESLDPQVVEVNGSTTSTLEGLEKTDLLDTVAHKSAIDDSQPGASELPAG